MSTSCSVLTVDTNLWVAFQLNEQLKMYICMCAFKIRHKHCVLSSHVSLEFLKIQISLTHLCIYFVVLGVRPSVFGLIDKHLSTELHHQCCVLYLSELCPVRDQRKPWAETMSSCLLPATGLCLVIAPVSDLVWPFVVSENQ